MLKIPWKNRRFFPPKKKNLSVPFRTNEFGPPQKSYGMIRRLRTDPSGVRQVDRWSIPWGWIPWAHKKLESWDMGVEPKNNGFFLTLQIIPFVHRVFPLFPTIHFGFSPYFWVDTHMDHIDILHVCQPKKIMAITTRYVKKNHIPESTLVCVKSQMPKNHHIFQYGKSVIKRDTCLSLSSLLTANNGPFIHRHLDGSFIPGSHRRQRVAMVRAGLGTMDRWGISRGGGHLEDHPSSRWWFQIFFIFIPTWGNDPFWLIFFKWVETTN